MDKPRTLLSLNEWSFMESDFRAFQNLVSEHSSEGAPASIYNLTKSAPDPCSSTLKETILDWPNT